MSRRLAPQYPLPYVLYVPLYAFSAPITLGEWHTFAIEVDFFNDRYAFFVDGTFLGQQAKQPQTGLITEQAEQLGRGNHIYESTLIDI